MNEAHQQQPVTVSSFRSGDWFGIVGPSVSVFLPPTEKGRVGALWEIVDGGADFDEVLDTLIASGLRSLPGFLLLGAADPDTRVVVRGPARATFDLDSGEQITVDGADARTWNERTLRGVDRVSVLLEEDAGVPGERSVDSGLVRVGRLDRPPVTTERAEIAAQAVPAPTSGWDADAGAGPAPSDVTGPLSGHAPITDVSDDDAVPSGDSADDPAVAGGVWGAAAGGLAGAVAAGAGQIGNLSDAATDPGTDPDPGAAVAEPTTGEEPTLDEVPSEAPALTDTSTETPSWQVPTDAAPPAEAVEEGAAAEPSEQGADETPTWSEPSALDAPSVPGWPAPAAAPEPSLEPPLSIGSWKRDDDPATGAPEGDAETEVFDAVDIAAEGSAEPDPVTPAPWPAPSVGDRAPSELPEWGAPAQSETPEHDGQTVSGGWDAGEFARQQPGIPGQPQAPEITAQPVATLVFAHGEVVAVDRAVLIGRAPEARRFTSTEQPRLVTVPSPNQEISSTHLEVRPGSGADHGSAIVTDMGSTNGTVLVQPGLAPESLTPGMPVQLLPGALIDLGDGMTIQVAGV